MIDYVVELKAIAPIWVASLRQIIPTYADAVGLFDELLAHLHQQGSIPAGSTFVLWHDQGYRVRDVDAEAAVPITGWPTRNDRINVREISGCDTAVCVRHDGARADLPQAYRAAFAWLETSTYALAGPSREVYLHLPDSDQQVIEVYIPVVPLTTERLIHNLRAERSRFLRLLDGLDETRLIESGVQDDWSIHDIIAHVTVWDRRGTQWIEVAARGDLPAIPEEGVTWDDLERLNRQTVLENQQRPTGELLAEFNQTFDQLLQVVAALRDEDLGRVLDWDTSGNMPVALTQLVVWRSRHLRAHGRSIAAWRRRQAAERRATMRAALCVHEVTGDFDSDCASIMKMVRDAAAEGANLVFFAEAALTGLLITDDPAHDLALGQPIPGTATEALATVARECGIWLALGILEREADRLYDAALLFAPDGTIALHYRRIRPHWHGRLADPAIYCQGSELNVVDTPFGRCAFLICGDLFGDDLIEQVRGLAVDWLLAPIARDFDEDVPDLHAWHAHEKYNYARRARIADVSMLLTNYIQEGDLYGSAFGGALVVTATGEIIAEWPLEQPGTLHVTL